MRQYIVTHMWQVTVKSKSFQNSNEFNKLTTMLVCKHIYIHTYIHMLVNINIYIICVHVAVNNKYLNATSKAIAITINIIPPEMFWHFHFWLLLLLLRLVNACCCSVGVQRQGGHAARNCVTKLTQPQSIHNQQRTKPAKTTTTIRVNNKPKNPTVPQRC